MGFNVMSKRVEADHVAEGTFIYKNYCSAFLTSEHT